MGYDEERELREQEERDEEDAIRRSLKTARSEDEFRDVVRENGGHAAFVRVMNPSGRMAPEHAETLRLATRRRNAEDMARDARTPAEREHWLAELETRRAEERAYHAREDAMKDHQEPQEPESGAPTADAGQEPQRPVFSGNRSYTVAEVAAASGRHIETVRRHIAAGRLKAHKTGGVGPWRIWGSDLEEWL